MRRFTRRTFLATGAATSAGLHRTTRLQAAAAVTASGRYAGAQSDRFLGPVWSVAQIDGDEVFTEGPEVDRASTVYVTDIPTERILKYEL